MKNWKTTIAGFIAGAIPILQGISDSMGAGVPIKWAPIVMGMAIMVLGVLAKDIGKVATILVVGLASMSLNACGASTQLVAATTSSGHSYPYCLEVTYPVLALQANVVFCGTVEAVQTEQAHLAKLYPQAKFAIVKGTQQ